MTTWPFVWIYLKSTTRHPYTSDYCSWFSSKFNSSLLVTTVSFVYRCRLRASTDSTHEKALSPVWLFLHLSGLYADGETLRCQKLKATNSSTCSVAPSIVFGTMLGLGPKTEGHSSHRGTWSGPPSSTSPWCRQQSARSDPTETSSCWCLGINDPCRQSLVLSKLRFSLDLTRTMRR